MLILLEEITGDLIEARYESFVLNPGNYSYAVSGHSGNAGDPLRYEGVHHNFYIQNLVSLFLFPIKQSLQRCAFLNMGQ